MERDVGARHPLISQVGSVTAVADIGILSAASICKSAILRNLPLPWLRLIRLVGTRLLGRSEPVPKGPSASPGFRAESMELNDELARASKAERIHTILEALVTTSNPLVEPNARRMGDFYFSCMNTAGIDGSGHAPLQPDFAGIAAIRSRADPNAVLAFLKRLERPLGAVNRAVVGPFRATSGQDPKNPTRVIARIVERDAAGRTGSSIFSLPDRDYYFRPR